MRRIWVCEYYFGEVLSGAGMKVGSIEKLGMRVEDAPCPVGCRPGADEYVLSGIDRLHGLPGEFRVVRCASCGLLRTNPRPREEAIGYYYPEEYGPHQIVLREGSEKNVFFRGLRKCKPQWLRNRRVPISVPGRLLEVGCGSGRYLSEMKEAGWQVKGIDASPNAAEAALELGLEVHCGPIRTLPEEWKPFDMITAWMAVEHLHDPVGDLARLRELVRDSGWLVLSVPDAGGRLGFRLFRSYWYALQLPTHLFHFTPASIRTVLEAANWKPEKIYWQYDSRNFLMSLCYWFSEHRLKPLARLFKIIGQGSGNPLVAGLAVLLGIFHCSGRIIVWARPDSSVGA